eukprot:CAMPEP_0181455078 /NCGR_PEP_ID=MMETSP1110-20121109/30572_1 /TAXON_ID=174948 /ORGANISM="Symbiodinium sp., Strain CCMP421" /LENGTH=139 /DNA_ID=CAMNT_0023579451 /DNA_START=33 /DNA_END=449 /DNA_ORIENTATION=+
MSFWETSSMRRQLRPGTFATLLLLLAMALVPGACFLRPPAAGRGIRRASPTTVAREVHRGAALRHEPVAKTAVAQADRQTPVQLWARGVLDWIHGFAFHLGLFCLLEEYVRLGFLGGMPAVPGQPVNFGMHLDGAVALQ